MLDLDDDTNRMWLDFYRWLSRIGDELQIHEWHCYVNSLWSPKE